ncbi:DNA alkylation repair protein [Xylanimonas oleitrophica]|uniref:DNA alkylation repair protein n=2 Tax=Xylanimonas oleitrophica TaxID=2607479 RepID=A0A2W5XSK1_9MICO|nr:DNA alkylation repair protein [Xylanimonas oleitrophica]
MTSPPPRPGRNPAASATGPLLTAAELARAVDAAADPEVAASSRRFFQTGPGQYAEGDRFAGVRVPVLRALAREAAAMPLGEASRLLTSEVHEHRLAALLVMVDGFSRASRARTRDEAVRDELHDRYLDAVRAGHVDGWDLVDTSAPTLVGAWLLGPPAHDLAPVLDPLTASPNLWQRRVAMLATFAFTRAGDPGPALTYAHRLLDDREPLLHKAVGWMLREVGKRADAAALADFLERHAHAMPRTALGYATEHLDPGERARLRAL